MERALRAIRRRSYAPKCLLVNDPRVAMTKAAIWPPLLVEHKHSINVDGRPLFDVAIQPLQVVIAQPDATVCGRESRAITRGPSV